VASKRKQPPRKGTGGRRLPRTALIIFALALAVRLIYLGGISRSPAYHVPIIDSATYDQHARLLVAKGIFYERFFWQGFFYPFFLAVVYFLTHGSMLAARLIQIVLGSLLCAGIYHLGSVVFDRRAGIVAGVVAALYGPLIFYDVEILDAGFSAIWAVVLILLLLRAQRWKRALPSVLLGVCGGLSVVTRGTFLPFFLVACVWLTIVWRRSAMPWRPVAARTALVLVGFLAVTMPVAQLCYRATGDFSFLSESGPINLFIGNNPERDKTIMIRPGAEWRELTRMPMVKGSISDVQDRDVFTHLFLDYVKAHPIDFAKGLEAKTMEFFSSRELPRNDDIYIARKYSGLFSALTWKAGKFGFPFGLLLPLALVGIARKLRRIPVPVYAFLLLYPAAIIGVFVSGRYRIPVAAVLTVPAAAGALYLVDSLRGRRWPLAALIAVSVCAIAAASSVAGPFVVEKYNYEAEMHSIVGFELLKQNRIDESVSELSEALRLDPNYGDAHKYLGLIMSQERRHAEAAVHLRKALDREPDSYLIRYYLGVTLLNLGKREEAIPLLQEARSQAAAAKEEQLVREIDRVLGSATAPREGAPPSRGR
jgi:4-amino-4-deoxy-L-arabinose transferase-like glycosyltransferase